MSTLAYIILYYALVSNFTREKVVFLVYSILGSAILVASYGVLEHFGIDKHLWVQDVQNRVFSTLGQPNWLSAYLVALIPLPILTALATKNNTHKAIWIAIATLFFITILYTKSQSGISATIAILCLIPIYLISKKTKLVIPIVAVILLAGLVLKWDFVQKVSPLGPNNLRELVEADRLDRIGGSDSMVIRQVVWQGARELGLRYPLFGTGVETFGYSYYNVRPALHNLLSEWEFLYNKAHNEYLNTLANTGFVGLASYLLLITWTIVWWLSRKEKTPIEDGLFLGYLSILITNYFGFSVVPVALFFYLFPALVLTNSKDKVGYRSINLNINSTLGVSLIAVLTLLSLKTPLNQLRSDLAYNRGKLYLAANLLRQSLDNGEEAIRLSPNEALFYASLAESQSAAASSVRRQLDSMEASSSAQTIADGDRLLFDLVSSAKANSEKAIALNPHHANLHKSKAKTELYLGTVDPKFNRTALETLINLTTIAPTDAKILFNIGALYQELGDKSKALQAFEKALELKPDYDAVKPLLAQ